MSNEETSFRQAQRLQRLAAQVTEKGMPPRTFAEHFARGTEGRMFTSDPARMKGRRAAAGFEAFGTEPIDERAAPLALEDAAQIAGAQLEERERAAAAKVVPTYMQPMDPLDPRLYNDLETHFRDAAGFAEWAKNESQETVAQALAVMEAQHAAKQEMAALKHAVPDWEAHHASVISYARDNGASSHEIALWHRNPSAAVWQQWYERMRDEERKTARERLRKHPRDFDAAADVFADEATPPAPTRSRIDPAERAAMVNEIRELGLSARSGTHGASEASVEAAGALFTRLLEDED